MNFLSPILLWGAAAISIPILVHLFNKNRYRIRQWGAMHLIEQTIKVQKRRLRIENWLLLLLRMMIPLLLAFCLARPRLTGMDAWWHWAIIGAVVGLALGGIYMLVRSRASLWSWLFCLAIFAIPGWLAYEMATFDNKGKVMAGDSEQTLIVMVDDSYSLEYQAPNGRLIEDARARAAELVGGLKPGSNVQVIPLSGGPLKSENPRSNLEAVKKELAGLNTGFGMAKPAIAFKQAANQLANREVKEVRNLVVLTDFQRASWGNHTFNALKQEVDAMAEGENKPALALMHIGRGEKRNLCVSGLDFPKNLPLAPKESIKVKASLRYFGGEARNQLPVEFLADGKPAPDSNGRPQAMHSVNLQGDFVEPVKVPANDSVRFAFEEPGTHVIGARIHFGPNENDDRLRADDTYLASVEVWKNVPVLILDGAPSANSLAGNIDLEGESDFLHLALQPFAGGQVKDATDLINARVLRATDFNEDAIDDARVIIMANVPQLTEPQITAIKNYVRRGGGLMIFLGDLVDANWYNTHLGDDGFLPAKLDTIQNLKGQKVPFARVSVDPPNGRPAPVMSMFSGDVSITARVHQWYRLNRPLKDAPYDELAALVTPDRDPLLLSRPAGEGRVLLCTTTCDEDWFSGIGAPFYVPLMQRLTLYLASEVSPRRNLTVGESLVARFPKVDIDKEIELAYYPLEAVTPEAVSMDAEGERQSLKITSNGGRGTIDLKTERPGLYVLRRPDGSLIHYAVMTSREESDLAQLDDSEIQQVADTLGAQLVSDVSEYTIEETQRRRGKEVWKWLMAAMLVLVIAELLLVQRMSRDKA